MFYEVEQPDYSINLVLDFSQICNDQFDFIDCVLLLSDACAVNFYDLMQDPDIKQYPNYVRTFSENFFLTLKSLLDDKELSSDGL